jgi:polyphosphate kinase
MVKSRKAAASVAAALGSGPRYLNRELSWLDFNDRVVALALDPDRPLLERAKFLAIASRNLDEFFQVRVAGLKDQVAADVSLPDPAGLSAREQMDATRRRVVEMYRRMGAAFLDEVAPALEKEGIRYSDWGTLDDEDHEHLVGVFERRIFPVLTPLAVDPAHPFPYISNLSMNLAVQLRAGRSTRFARVKVPPLLPRFVVMPDGERFVPVEQVIAENLDRLFPGATVVSRDTFRVTRDTDVELAEEAADLLSAVQTVLRERRRSEHAVRLEVSSTMSNQVRRLLMRELELEPRDVYEVVGPVDLGGLWSLYELNRPDLKDPQWIPITQPALRAPSIFQAMSAGDILVHHPYDAFATSVEAFIDQAARDPDVLAIKQTLYRTSGGESPIVRALIRAAESGKQVVALVELTARFDEQANIAWAEALEEAGVHVVYGVVGLKTHAKTTLVVRQEDGEIRRYVHIGTGNYNSSTASQYEDIGLLSTDPDLGADLAELFNFLTGYGRDRKYRKLLVTPSGPRSFRKAVIGMIREEAKHNHGRIVFKLNSLVDPDVIDALYAASQKGVEIDLIVRGICCLRPGVPGLSETIRVRSVVGRYLEHSRIFRFGTGHRRRTFIGSADLMQRNLDRRVEAITPVEDPDLQDRLDEVLRTDLADDVLAWSLGPDGAWTKVPTETGVNTHERLQDVALARARGVEPPPLPGS